MNELDTSFKQRLGEPLTDRDRSLADTDMITLLANEIIALWGEIEKLRRRLGDEGPF